MVSSVYAMSLVTRFTFCVTGIVLNNTFVHSSTILKINDIEHFVDLIARNFISISLNPPYYSGLTVSVNLLLTCLLTRNRVNCN